MLKQINQYNVEAGQLVRYRLYTGQVVEVEVKGHVTHTVGSSQHRLFTILCQGQLRIALPEELFVPIIDET